MLYIAYISLYKIKVLLITSLNLYDQHIKQFGADHPRSIEILNMDAKCYP
ncbi:hypothetical protein REISMN_05255 [Rickettsia tamurae subsp. buchneri]|uniref:Uncharacterized protein n=1 Tax=Rickettsia tamurae subsp. buchneri TaxID=1462938 RepID=A0A8E0WLL8_9RICK|nr:hypothetical protein REIS_1803 [Rickettsia endosymbiont of Ixodes scapularis]KDO02746.1 hypothetical protein REISMN_05255 [Rickettsia tamurae subsp. buchneri]